MITLNCELYSSKNSKRILGHGKRQFIGKSAKALENERELLLRLSDATLKSGWSMPERWPVYLHVDIYRKTNRRYDFTNITQLLFDCMVKSGYLPDDDWQHIIPVFYPHKKDKDNPRVNVWWSYDK